MREFRLFFAVLFLAVFTMCFTYHSRLMPFLLMTMTLVCVLSFIIGLAARFNFSVKVSDAPAEVERKDAVILKVSLKNNFILPLTPVRLCVLACVEGVYIPQREIVIISVPPMREVSLDIKNVMSFRGEYRIGIEKAEFFDVLKLFKFKVNPRKMFDVISYPRELTVSNLPDDNRDGEEALRSRPRGLDRDSFANLREYREGEPLRHIHWNLSARLDELIVKQMESGYNYSALILCDFTAEKGSSAESVLESSDSVIEMAAAIIRSILSNGNSADIIWQDCRTQNAERKIANDFGSYEKLINSLFSLPAKPFGGEFTELFKEFRDEFRTERLIYIIAPVTEDLVDELRETGLVFNEKVVLAEVPSPAQHQRLNLTEFLKTQTKITVINV